MTSSVTINLVSEIKLFYTCLFAAIGKFETYKRLWSVKLRLSVITKAVYLVSNYFQDCALSSTEKSIGTSSSLCKKLLSAEHEFSDLLEQSRSKGAHLATMMIYRHHQQPLDPAALIGVTNF